MSAIEIVDCNGTAIVVGVKIDGGNGVTGEVVEIPDPDDTGQRVGVLWPDGDSPEFFTASVSLADWRRDGVYATRLTAEEIEVVDG